MSTTSPPASVVGPAVGGLDRLFTTEALELLGTLRLTDGSVVTAASVREVLVEEVTRLVGLSPDEATAGRVREAAELFEVVALDEVFVDFLTLPAYDRIVDVD